MLFLTPIQFTALWWTELSYKLGALTGITLTTEIAEEPIKRVILFVLTQTEILDDAARMSLGEGSFARDLIKGSFENPPAFMADRYACFRAASIPFESEHWAEMTLDAR